MDTKPEASLPPTSVVVDSEDGQNGASSLAGPPPKKDDANFFDYHGDDNIWGSDFTKALRKTRSVTLLTSPLALH